MIRALSVDTVSELCVLYLKYSQLNIVQIENCNLGAYYCIQQHKKGGAATLSIRVYISHILILLNIVKNKI